MVLPGCLVNNALATRKDETQDAEADKCDVEQVVFNDKLLAPNELAVPEKAVPDDEYCNAHAGK